MTPEEYTIKKIDLAKKGLYVWSDWSMKMLKDGFRYCTFKEDMIKKISKYPVALVRQTCLTYDNQCYLAKIDMFYEPYKRHVKFYRFNQIKAEGFSDERLIEVLDELLIEKERNKKRRIK